MRSLWKTLSSRRSVAKLLIVAVFLTTLMPAHYHLHHIHSAESTAHEHAIDLHVIADTVEQSHHDENTSVFAATPDVIVKKSSIDIHPYMLLTILLVLLAIFDRVRIHFRRSDSNPVHHYPFLTPPLRAPPQS